MEPNEKRNDPRRQEDWLKNSSIEETLTLLIENLSMLNHVISHDAKDNKDTNLANKDNIQEIIDKLNDLPMDDIIKSLKDAANQTTVWNGIADRLINHKKVK